MKKTLKSIFFIFSISFLLLSCSKEEDKETYVYEKETTIFLNSSFAKQGSESEEGQILKTVITSNIPLDSNLSEENLEKYIKSSNATIKIETLIDDNSIITIDIKDDMVELSGRQYPNSGLCPECSHDSNGNISDSMNCTQQGIKHCAYATYQQWSTPKIIYESLSGGAGAVITDCIGRNCMGW